MFFILNGAVKKLFNLGMEMLQPSLLFHVGEVYGHISTRGDNVEFGVKCINPVNNSVESRKRERSVALILTNSVLAVKNEHKILFSFLRKSLHIN